MNFSLPLEPDSCSSSSHPTGASVRSYFQCNFWTRNPQIQLCGRIYAACIQSPSAYLLLPSCSPRRRWRREKNRRRFFWSQIKEIWLVVESMQFSDRLKMIIRGCQHGRVKSPELKSFTLVTQRATNTIQYNYLLLSKWVKDWTLKATRYVNHSPNTIIVCISNVVAAQSLSCLPNKLLSSLVQQDTFVHCARAVATEETVFSITSSAMHSDDGFNRPTSFTLLPGTSPASETHRNWVSSLESPGLEAATWKCSPPFATL